MPNHCGECNACCKVFNIPELKKPAGVWCEHCIIGKTCTIYETRPQACIDFECFWLQSQKRDPKERWAPELRPDKCKVVFSTSTNPSVVSAITMPGANDAWRRPVILSIIKGLASRGFATVCGGSNSTRRTMIDKYGIREVTLTEPDEYGVQWGTDD
jgi:hypothetical protein